MAENAITQEQATKEYQEAEDKAIMAGADIEDISSIRSRYGLSPAEEVEVLPPISAELAEELPPIIPETLEKARYPQSAATDVAAASTLLSENGSVEDFDRIKEELLNTNKSDQVEMQTAHLNERNKEIMLGGASLALESSELSEEEKNVIAQNIQDGIAETYPYDLADEVTIMSAEEAALDAVNEEASIIANRNIESLEDRLHQRNRMMDVVGRAAEEGLNWSLKTASDVARQLVAVDDVVTYNELAEVLDVEVDAALAPGDILSKIKEKIDGLPSMEEKANAAVFVSEYLKENAGAVSEMFGSNMVNRVIVLHDLFGQYISNDPDSWWENVDVDEFLLDLGPVLDGLVVASGVGAAAKAAQVTGRLRRLAGLPRMDAANPAKAAEIAEEAVVNEKVAEMASVSAEELKIAAGPKVEGWKEGQMSGRTAGAVNRQAESQELLKTAKEVEDFITAARGKEAAIKGMQEAADAARGKSYWVADTNIAGQVGKDWRASILVGKTQDRGFDTLEAAKAALKEDFNGQGTVLTRTSRIEPMKAVVEEGKELKEAARILRGELEQLRSTKLSRGEEKAIRKEVNKLKATIAERQREIVQAEKGLAAGTKASREAKADELSALKRDLSPAESELAELEHFLELSTTGAKAEAEISRIDGGHLDKLSPSSMERIKQLTASTTISEARAAKESIEYFVQADTKGSIGFAKGDIAMPIGGSKGTWMFDADSAIAPKIAQAGHALFDKWKWAEQQLLDYLDPFAKLSRAEQIKISKALALGNKNKKVFNATDLKTMDITSQKSIDAYRSYRKFADIMYDLEDDLFLKTLVKDDMRKVVSGDYITYARPLSDAELRAVKHVYDPEAKTVVDISTIKDPNYTVAKLRKSEFVGEEGSLVGASHIIIRGKSNMQALPETGLLNRVEGYVPMTHKSNYFITKTEDVVLDGVKGTKERTVGVVNSINEAKELIANLKNEGKLGYDYKHDRALTAQDRSFEDHMMDLHHVKGTLFYGARSEKGLEGFLGAADELVDPLEAAVNAASRISRDITLRPFIDDMKARFVKSYNEMLANPGVFPAHATSINKTGKLSDWEVVEARRAFNHIETLEGLSTSAGFRRMAIQAADLVEGTSETLAKAIRASSDLDPVGTIRSFNFNVNLRSNPLAQLIVQPSQTLNMFGLEPATFVMDFNYGRKLTLAARHKLDLVGSEKELSDFARMAGLSVEQAKADIKAFRESGLGQAVSAQETARDAVKPLSTAMNAGPIKRAGNAAVAPFSATLNFLGKGFNRGEEINLGLHYLVARRRWMRKNPDANPYSTASQLEIAGEARALSGSMIQTGDFAYQKGIFAIPFQYAAIMQKQLLLMLPKYGNKALTSGERFRIAAAQTAMWGPAGIGLGFLVEGAANEMGINLKEGVAEVLNDGLMEWGLNNFLSYVADEETDLDFSGRFAPAAGLFGDNIFTLIADAITSGESRDLYKVFIGPTHNNANRIANAIDTTLKMFGTEDVSYKDLGAPADAVLDVFSGWNNTTKAMLYSKKDYFTDTKGRKLFRHPTGTEIWAMGTIGLVPKEIDAYYKLKLNKQDWEKHLSEVAEEYYSHILRLTDHAIERGDATGWSMMGNADEQFQNLLRVEKGIIDAYEGDAPIIMDKLVQKIKENISSVGSDKLIVAIQKLAIAHGGSSDVQGLVQQLINTGLITEEDRQQITDFTRHLTGE